MRPRSVSQSSSAANRFLPKPGRNVSVRLRRRSKNSCSPSGVISYRKVEIIDVLATEAGKSTNRADNAPPNKRCALPILRRNDLTIEDVTGKRQQKTARNATIRQPVPRIYG